MKRAEKKIENPKVQCPRCRQSLTVVQVAGRASYNFHHNSGQTCAASYEPVPVSP